MGKKHDYWEDWRTYIIPKLGIAVNFINDTFRSDLYTRTESRNREFVGRIPMGEEEFEKYLTEWGFERNPLAALKIRAKTGEVEEGSWRKVERGGERQLHLILYDGSQLQNANTGECFLYAHWEYRWDVHPWKHYKGVDVQRHKGVLKMRRYLEDAGIAYEYVQP